MKIQIKIISEDGIERLLEGNVYEVTQHDIDDSNNICIACEG